MTLSTAKEPTALAWARKGLASGVVAAALLPGGPQATHAQAQTTVSDAGDAGGVEAWT